MKDGAHINTFCAHICRNGRTVKKTFRQSTRYETIWPVEKLLLNEALALKKVQKMPGFQQVVSVKGLSITSIYHGHKLRRDDMVAAEALEQCMRICNRMKIIEMVHRDVRPENLVCHDGVVTLIDFTWAYFPGCVFRSMADAPKEMGGRYRSKNGIDDTYSMVKSLHKIYED